ncbi:fumarate reductase subunit D [Vibrio cholerae]|nr:fumarate reductase subunit D [Vibrio cholerae]
MMPQVVPIRLGGKLVDKKIIVLHRVHHGMHDLKFHTGVAGKIACYGFATIISALAVVFIFMI